MRTAEVKRETKETKIAVKVNLDGRGVASVRTGIGFFDHMLTALSVHSGIDLEVQVEGDLYVDCHHSIEDTGIVLGKALGEALGDKGGIARYGSAYIPMRRWGLLRWTSADGRFWCSTASLPVNASARWTRRWWKNFSVRWHSMPELRFI